MNEDVEDEYQIKDRDDDIRYEAIEEEFEFSGQNIKPCYCVLPFVTDEEVEASTKRNIAVSTTCVVGLSSSFTFSKSVHRNTTNSLKSTQRMKRVKW